MITVNAGSFARAYEVALRAILNEGFDSSPRGQPCVGMPMQLTYRPSMKDIALFESPVRSTNLRYLAGELCWYFHGQNDFETIASYSDFWRKVYPNATKDTKVHSAYGHELFARKNAHGLTEWQWCVNQLRADPDTRQAIMLIATPDTHYFGNGDVPCTLNIGFRLRGSALSAIVTARSCDMWFGLPYDAPFFNLLARQVAMAVGPEVRVSQITHVMLDAHIYRRNEADIRAMIESGITASTKLPPPRARWLNDESKYTEAFCSSRGDELANRLHSLASNVEVLW